MSTLNRTSSRPFALVLPVLLLLSVPSTVSAQTHVESATCSKIGQSRRVSGSTLVCRQVGKKRVWVAQSKTATPSPAVMLTASPASLDSCRLPDRRDPSLVDMPRSLGFPLNQSRSKASGKLNLVLVAADFPNFPGAASEITKLKDEIRKFDQWLAFQSNGRLSANWQFPAKWHRLPLAAADYGVVGFQPLTHNRITADVISAADPDVSFAGIDEMFVYLPDSLTKSEPNRDPFQGILPQFGGKDVATPEGVIMQVKGSGTVSQMPQYGYKPTPWALWAHDLLHQIGIEGHNPVESFTLESEDYTNFVMSAWNQFLAGWMRDDQVACVPLSEIAARTVVELDLVPLQLANSGFRTVIVPLSESRAIVVESHRKTGYAANFGASGILTYLMDTKNVLPYAQRENTASVGSRFLDPNRVQIGARPRVGNARKSAVMLQGESASFENLKIEFVKAGVRDRVRISVAK